MKQKLTLLFTLFLLVACTTDNLVVQVTDVWQTAPTMVLETAVPPLTAAPVENTSEPVVTPASLVAQEEAILIQEPGPGSRLSSPLVVRGLADSTFEQNLVVRLVADDGAELGLTAVTIASELGQRGPFEATLPFNITGERQAFIQVFASSPRDGGITHLSSVGVILTDGEPQIQPAPPDTAERITINQPTVGTEISGGSVHIAGVGLASFEQTLLVELVDGDGEPEAASGRVLTSQPVTVNAPDLGQPGEFSVDLPYSVAATGPGRIVIRDISPAFGGDTHLASVEVMLSP